MPPRQWELRIKDILKAIEKILFYTADMKFEEFANDSRTVDAVTMNFAVIGEAANHIPENIMNAYTEIPWSDMRDMRNVMVHEYFGVSQKILWETIQSDLPPLTPLLKNILKSE